MHPVIHAAANTAEDFEGGLPGMAAALQMPYQSLYQQLNEVGIAKLGVLTAIKMVNRSRDARVVCAINEATGFMPPIPRPQALDVPGDEAMAHVARTIKEVADVAQAVCSRVGDGISDNDMEVILREWGEAMAAGVAMIAHLERMHQAARPAHLREG
jgi:hypothetical protein